MDLDETEISLKNVSLSKILVHTAALMNFSKVYAMWMVDRERCLIPIFSLQKESREGTHNLYILTYNNK